MVPFEPLVPWVTPLSWSTARRAILAHETDANSRKVKNKPSRCLNNKNNVKLNNAKGRWNTKRTLRVEVNVYLL